MELNEIGALIKEARKNKGLTQEAAGKPLGMSRATISGIETGKIAEVGLRKTMALCALVGLELNVSPRRKYPTLQELRKENNAKNGIRVFASGVLAGDIIRSDVEEDMFLFTFERGC